MIMPIIVPHIASSGGGAVSVAGFAAALHVHRDAELRTPADAVAAPLGLALARGLLRVQADRDRQVQGGPDDAVLLGVVSGRVALAR